MLMMVGGLVALLCLGGAGVAFVAYREATEPDRSAPDVAVSNYLRALFVERNDVDTSQYSCEDQAGLASIKAFMSDLESREERFGAQFNVSWGSLNTGGGDRVAEVSVDLQISALIDGVRQSDVQSWRFEVVDEEGWRVCSAVRA
ncbi:hypothetical protein [Micromonospora sp. CPCC 206061]|uniref:hypothetical protein n=1 Tax=Micromonospora sp. CPCC 206061 TaxID=3122410 RepID=UPI002FF3774D